MVTLSARRVSCGWVDGGVDVCMDGFAGVSVCMYRLMDGLTVDMCMNG